MLIVRKKSGLTLRISASGRSNIGAVTPSTKTAEFPPRAVIGRPLVVPADVTPGMYATLIKHGV